jgi:hypothetical protein
MSGDFMVSISRRLGFDGRDDRKPAHQGEKGATMTTTTAGNDVKEVSETVGNLFTVPGIKKYATTKSEEKNLQQLHNYEKQTSQRFETFFDRVEKYLDDLEKQTTQDKEATQKLQKQGKQCETMQATFQQSLITQNDQILQIQSDCDGAT